MYEIRFHGRGGQGAVTASKILATAAFLESKWVTSFPFFGTERRGAPVTAFTRIDEKKIELRSQIYEPDAVVVLDKSLMKVVNVTEGLKSDGVIIVNGKTGDLVEAGKYRVGYVDATSIALRNGLGDPSHPIVNTAILGAFAKVSNLVSLQSIKNATSDTVPSKKKENVNAIQEAYEETELN
ncbi:MAG: Pyruvate ferredoxin oxidoreductase [POR] gamma subunit [Thermoplasmatales archaeon I-plasma]|jgi:pyruvate ferredoxin oxidoreductase gamma subunit/2-oxoisovalerate ferredoxin oxidoreductase gamma subunit|nr:MAG: Pyruvate ferredoxin oxidoreductase [POR] gamma subunit [Thermoplasmatales archaeon I-plasma]MCL4450905.1 2-oxoacid:acceptor oxidoreductase family protein [Candidatus Thermoplasmatota archaeon]MCL5930626.1 2-oxoacid:acceptor oxidoreductase family protein [Candidatus Thermoplasmatota archaeon]